LSIADETYAGHGVAGGRSEVSANADIARYGTVWPVRLKMYKVQWCQAAGLA